MGEFRMPSLGADMEVGTVSEWRVTPGQTVHRGDIVAVIETEKAAIEVEVFEDGVVGELIAAVGDEVPVGGVLATIVSADGDRGGAASAGDRGGAAPPPPPPPPPAPAAPTAPVTPSRPRRAAAPAGVHSPVVRHLAERLGVDIAAVHGTGPDGTVTRADVERAAAGAASPRVRATPYARRLARERGVDLATLPGAAPGAPGGIVAADVLAAGTPTAPAQPAVTPPPDADEPRGPEPRGPEPRDAAARRRASVAALMARSKREIPHFYLSSTIDMQEALQWLTTHNEERSVHDRLLPAALLLRATVLAAQEVPTMNGHWLADGFVPAPKIDLGVAVHLRDGGLVAPTIGDADALDLDALMAQLRDLVAGARRGTLRGSQMTTPTITVTNIGEQGVEQLFAVIYPPQVAMVGFGAINERPWAVDGMLTVRPTVTATLAADHRASDGHEGARFLSAVDRHLQHPDQL